MAEKQTFSSVLQNRGFLNLWINQILVQLSQNSLNFALLFWVFKLTNSVTAVSALLVSIYLPAILFGLFSGVLVDLTDRKKIILLIDFLLSLCFFSLIFLKESYPAILIITFLINTLGQFYGPAEASAIPLVVERKQLLSANSLFSATLYSCFLLGFGMSGPLINHLGIDFIFGFGGVLLLLAFCLAFAFPSIKAIPSAEGLKLIEAIVKKNFKNIKDIGLQEIVKTIRLIKGKLALLTSIGILAGIQMVIGILAILMPAFLERSLQTRATHASYILIMPLGLGIVLGGVILGRIGHRFVKRLLVSRAIILSGVLFSLTGIIPGIPLLLTIGSFLQGIAMVAILVPSQTVLQENTPDEDKGKVFSVLGVAMAALSMIPVLLCGFLADLFGVKAIFIGVGLIIMLFGIIGLKPSLFFSKNTLPLNVRQFLGLGHWEKDVS